MYWCSWPVLFRQVQDRVPVGRDGEAAGETAGEGEGETAGEGGGEADGGGLGTLMQ